VPWAKRARRFTSFGARDYSAELGRFLCADPLAVHALGGELNPYAYVGGRVATHTDPLGLETDQKPLPTPDSTPPQISEADAKRLLNGGEPGYHDDDIMCGADGQCSIKSPEITVVGKDPASAATPPEAPTTPPDGDNGKTDRMIVGQLMWDMLTAPGPMESMQPHRPMTRTEAFFAAGVITLSIAATLGGGADLPGFFGPRITWKLPLGSLVLNTDNLS
jgi:RHS repeat-associated protein